ncbi:MAG: ammonia-forming cytochrome c nitrite reductase subunit c552, partial [Bacteroidales bacterium]
MFKKLSESIKNRPVIGWAIFAFVMVAVFMLGLLAASITERRAEIATLYANKKIEIEGINPKNEEWGINYPRQYDTWKRTKEMNFTSKHLGNTKEDMLESRPNMVVLWAGYAFS